MKYKLGVSYYGNRIPWRVREDLKVIREAGCNTILHTFSEQDAEFYEGAVAEIVADSKKAGLEVWLDPWGVGQVFGGETYSSLIAKDLSVRQVSSEGESLPMACPNQSGFRDYLTGWIEKAAKMKPDVLFWDEPHFKIYPEPATDPSAGRPEPDKGLKLWACRCQACQDRYQAWAGGPMPEVMDKAVRAFKEQTLVEFVGFLSEATAAKGIKAAVCMLPFENSSTVGDWGKIAALTPEFSRFLVFENRLSKMEVKVGEAVDAAGELGTAQAASDERISSMERKAEGGALDLRAAWDMTDMLLARVDGWDRRFGQGRFEIGYYDRVEGRVLIVPFNEIRFPEDDHRTFELIDDEGEIHRIPYHRVRSVSRNGAEIWRRNS